MRRVAGLSLRQYDSGAEGLGHTLSQRFLNPNWQGLRPGDGSDPPLREFIEELACGMKTLSDYATDPSPTAGVKSLLKWLSGLRLVPRLTSMVSAGSLVA